MPAATTDLDAAVQRLTRKNILIAEDNDLNQELLIEVFEEFQIPIDIANNGQEAIEKLESNRYDIILMDCRMPVMDGYEATRLIRQDDKFKDLPIIAMTGNVMSTDIRNVKDCGMNDHIAKPFDPDDLLLLADKWTR